jgi:hypothetical protein
MSDLVGKVDRIVTRAWVTELMNSKMDDRRKGKSVNKEEGRKNYRTLRQEFKAAT